MRHQLGHHKTSSDVARKDQRVQQHAFLCREPGQEKVGIAEETTGWSKALSLAHEVRPNHTLYQDDAKDRLQELNQQFMDLEAVIAKGKTFTLDDHDSDSDSEDHVEMTIHCVTCGSNIQVDTAIRHMERCYNKVRRALFKVINQLVIFVNFKFQVESQTSFASKFKTSIEDNRLFCDFYNSKEQSYCKRLKVLCPEHNPDPKAADEEVYSEKVKVL